MSTNLKPISGINKVAVIGAGVMGAGIAAQVANAGVEVLLLDISSKGKNKNIITEEALAKLKKSKPATFMHPSKAKLVTIGNIDDDLEKIKKCDWVIEVIIENLKIKQDLYKKIDKYCSKDAVISSNTSTLPLGALTKGMSEGFKKQFLITHFFNPPRYMRLIELVTTKKTSKAAEAKIRNFVDYKLGKSIVDCRDTPGFIANRIGTYWLHTSVVEAIKQDIGVEEADSVLSRPIGVPKTGVFALLDLIGLDVMPYILNSMMEALPKDDAFQKIGELPAVLDKLIADGYTGRKGKGGFYRLNTEGGKKQKEVISLVGGTYSKALRLTPDATKASKKHGLRGLLSHQSKEGKYAWEVMAKTLSYAASLAGEIAGDIETIDRAMRLGYNWKWGPFELIDKMGTSWFTEKLKGCDIPIPEILNIADGKHFYRTKNGKLQCLGMDGSYSDVKRPDGVLLLEDIKRATSPILTNSSATVWDIGDNIACLEFHSKMNSLNPFNLHMINKAVKELPKLGYKGLVIHNEATNFSVGANIGILLLTFTLRLYPIIRWILKQGQSTLQNLKYAPFPVVGAPSGMALGGGCEVLLHCDAIQANAESYIGLVEAGVGVIPGWGGCKEMLGRAKMAKDAPKGQMPAVVKAFETIATAKVSLSAYEAKDLQFLRESDSITMNRDRLLHDAKQKTLAMVDGYVPPEAYIYNLPGKSGRAALSLGIRDFVKKGVASNHDSVVVGALGDVLTGGDTDLTEELTENDILKLERDAFVKLTKTVKTRDRVSYMIKNGRPLRN